MTVSIVTISACLGLQTRIQATPTALQNVPGPHPVDVAVVSKDELGMVSTQADKLAHNIKKLSTEFNRREEVPRWNGMFAGAEYGGYGYSSAEMMPTGGGLATEVVDGPLLPPRQDIVDDLTDKVTNDMNACLNLIRQASVQASTDDSVKAQWKVAMDTAMALRQDCQKLDDMCEGPTYDQPEIQKLLRKFDNDAQGLRALLKKLHDSVKE